MTEDSVEELVGKIYRQMYTSRKKYKWWLLAMKWAPFPGPHSAERKVLKDAYYYALHKIDDLVDGDLQLPAGVMPTQYVRRKLEYVAHGGMPQDDVETLLMYSFKLGDRFGINLRISARDNILLSLMFDAQRREAFLQDGRRRIFPEQVLHYHFDLLDIRGTIPYLLGILKEDQAKHKYLESLGLASRTYYNLRDFDGDIRAGYINISQEDCERFGINEENVNDRNHPATKQWFFEQSRKGLQLIREHHRRLSEAKFQLFTIATLFFMYEQSAQRYFKKVLHA